jgi:hypothetical protein
MPVNRRSSGVDLQTLLLAKARTSRTWPLLSLFVIRSPAENVKENKQANSVSEVPAVGQTISENTAYCLCILFA